MTAVVTSLMGDNVPIAPGEKYGMLAFPSVATARGLPTRIKLRDGLWVFTELPFGIPEHWREWIGSLRYEALSDGDLFLVAGGSSTRPEVLDDENSAYETRAYNLYLGLLVSGHVIARKGLDRLTGANRDDEVDVRSIGQLDQPRWIQGTPLTRITGDQLDSAGALVDVIYEVRAGSAYNRVQRSLRAFHRGILADYADEKVHQYLRCLEGLIIPEPGRTLARLKSRTELFIGPSHHDRVEEWFEVRSAVEHLHPALEVVPGDDHRDREVRLLRRALSLEAVARDCLRRVLGNERLRSRFETDESIEAFWGIEKDERRELWGDPLDVVAVEESFREEAIPAEE